jgi:ketosteroid isomerase-like protein
VAVGDTVREQDAVLAARRLLDAFNERDFDALRADVTDDVELRLSDGRVWRGADGARQMLAEARDTELRLIPLHRDEHSEERDGVVYVELRVLELLRYESHERIADFQVRDGHVASLTLRPVEDPLLSNGDAI